MKKLKKILIVLIAFTFCFPIHTNVSAEENIEQVYKGIITSDYSEMVTLEEIISWNIFFGLPWEVDKEDVLITDKGDYEPGVEGDYRIKFIAYNKAINETVNYTLELTVSPVNEVVYTGSIPIDDSLNKTLEEIISKNPFFGLPWHVDPENVLVVDEGDYEPGVPGIYIIKFIACNRAIRYTGGHTLELTVVAEEELESVPDVNEIQIQNEWEQELEITGWKQGEYNASLNAPRATAKYGEVVFTYSNTVNGEYTSRMPQEAGTWYVKATVEETDTHTGLVAIKPFEIEDDEYGMFMPLDPIVNSERTLHESLEEIIWEERLFGVPFTGTVDNVVVVNSRDYEPGVPGTYFIDYADNRYNSEYYFTVKLTVVESQGTVLDTKVNYGNMEFENSSVNSFLNLVAVYEDSYFADGLAASKFASEIEENITVTYTIKSPDGTIYEEKRNIIAGDSNQGSPLHVISNVEGLTESFVYEYYIPNWENRIYRLYINAINESDLIQRTIHSNTLHMERVAKLNAVTTMHHNVTTIYISVQSNPNVTEEMVEGKEYAAYDLEIGSVIRFGMVMREPRAGIKIPETMNRDNVVVYELLDDGTMQEKETTIDEEYIMFDMPNLRGTFILVDNTEEIEANNTSVHYQTHVESVGWQDWKFNGEISGTNGHSKRLEGIRVDLKDQNYTGNIEYRTHIESIGWQGWQSNSGLSGTIGQSKRLEAVEIKLTGEMAKQYDVYYRVHAESYGWLGWAKNGNAAGTAGQSKRLEAIEIVLVEKGGPAPGSTSKAYIQNYVSYQTHVQGIGWQAWRKDGEMSGTSGQSRRLEGIKLEFSNQQYAGNIQYRTHVESIGWQGWQSNGSLSGTSGQSKRLEAIEIRLTGEMANQYDVYYRVHAESNGWLGWAKNGSPAGTAGFSRRLEGIEVILVEKGSPAPGSTSNTFIQK